MSEYKVAAGDTLSAIARRNGISLDALLILNPQIENPHQLRVGESINLPAAKPDPIPAPASALLIQPTGQHSSRPPDAPLVIAPARVTMPRPAYYVSERGPILGGPIFCGQAFARTVLDAMHKTLESAGWSIAHIGVYNPRPARRANGQPIRPFRWSNHAHAEAMDFKGIVDADGDLFDIPAMKRQHKTLLDALLDSCEASIVGAGRKAEIVDEGGWVHIGLWPE